VRDDLGTVERPKLRAFERRVLRLADRGVAIDEIAERFRRSPEFIGRVVAFTQLPGRTGSDHRAALRPLEHCILGWRARGAAYADIAPRLGRSPEFVERVEGFARYKLAAS